MDEKIKEFYDFLRYAISMAQNKLPAIVIEDIKKQTSNYLGKMNSEELANIERTLESYDEYYLDKCNLVDELKKRIGENPYSKEISLVFAEQLSELSVELEKMDFIRNYFASVIDLIDEKISILNEVKKHV